MYRCLSAVGRVAKGLSQKKSLREMSDLKKIVATSEEILRQIKSVKDEVTNLEKIIEDRYSAGDGIEIENERLQRQVESYKQELINLEIANGIAQIPTKFEHKADSSSGSGGGPAVGEAKPVAAKQQEQPPEPAVEPRPPPAEKTQQPKQAKKKEKAEKKPEDNKSKDGQSEQPVDVGRLDFRIGKIIEIKKHPDADSLYVEQIDVGQDKPLTVVSGLVKHISADEMLGRLVVLLCNLKPAKMRGITSEAMVMCANSPDKVEVLCPPPGCVPGDLVEVEGYPRTPDAVLNPKKKVFETVQPDLKTNAEKEATYKGSRWTVPGKGHITSATLTGANIK